MSNLNDLINKKYNEESILYIPKIENKNYLYDINNIYTPRKFSDTTEYITHLENLRKLKNYTNINKHLELLENSVYKNIVKKKLLQINWHSKIKEQTIEEKENLVKKMNNIKRCNSVLKKTKNINKLEQKRCKSNLEKKIETELKSTLNYKNLKKVDIKKSDINDLKKDLKLNKLKLPKI